MGLGCVLGVCKTRIKIESLTFFNGSLMGAASGPKSTQSPKSEVYAPDYA
jgi:hypothetical protein